MSRRGRGVLLGIDARLEHLRRRLVHWARLQGAIDPENVAGEVLRRAVADAGAGPALTAYLDDASGPAPDAEWPVGRLIAWLRTAVAFVASEQRRTADARLVVPASDDRPLEAIDRSTGVLAQLIDAELRAKVQACLAALPTTHGQAVRLWAHGLTYKDIATRLNATTTAVTNWIARGLDKLSKCVDLDTPRRGGAR